MSTIAPSVPTAKDFVREPVLLEFLGLPDSGRLLEEELESALMDNLQKFLLELGKRFAFVARQQRMSTETQDFYIDLVYYIYLLKCFVLIDLKVGHLTHQDIGQMDMYVRLYDDQRRGDGDKGKRQNQLTDEHIARIIETYQKRPVKPIERYARRVKMTEIEANDFNLNISRYASTPEAEKEIGLAATHAELVEIEKSIRKATGDHNKFLKELGLPPLP